MKQQAIVAISRPIRASVSIPGSKSITNRALLLAALAEGKSHLSGVLFCDDTEAFALGLAALGISVLLDKTNCSAEIIGQGGRFPNQHAAIYCRDSGIATRFLLSACAVVKGEYQFSASRRMSERPIAALLQVLQQQGAHFLFAEQHEHLPLLLQSAGLSGGDVHIDIRQSSQFLSALMIAAPYAKSPMRLHAEDLSNKPYVTMTANMMQAFGVAPTLKNQTVTVPQGKFLAQQYAIEPDASTASYFFAMAAITGGEIHVKNLTRACLQGDIRFLAVLEKMGCTVIEQAGGITVQGPASLKGLGEFDMSGFTDTFMTLAVLAVFADCPSTLKGLAHTRLQESDRIAAMVDGLTRLGIRVASSLDSITIYPGKAHGATLSSFADHRIAMSLAVIGLKIPGVIIEGADAVAKTCPQYFDMLNAVCMA